MASFAAATLAFHFIGSIIGYSAGLVGAVPITAAALFFGPRAAVATLILEGIANIGIINSNGTTPSSELTFKVIEGAVLSLAAIAIGAAMSAKSRLAAALLTDTVTGLPNRPALLHEVDRLLKGRGDLTSATVDLEDFGAVTDSFGQNVAEELLREVAARVVRIAGTDGFAARVPSERFVIVWARQEQSDEAIARAMLEAGRAEVVVRGVKLQVRARACVARRSVTRTTTGAEFTGAARAALERARRTGNDWCAAEPLSTTDGEGQLETLGELGHAIQNGDLRLHYQPIMELPSRSVRGFEALVRWQHPTRGLIPPMEFIPLAEQSGLIVPLTDWVISAAMRQSRAWADQGLRAQISINVGAKTLAPSVDLPERIARFAREQGVDLASFTIEVTETDVMRDPVRSVAILGALKALGLRIELDDFGTGYSSLSYLRDLPLDAVKIDRSFIFALLADTSTAAIVRAAIDLAHALGLEAVGEGVEDEMVVARLAATGCDAVQGFFFARPMPANDVPAWMTTHTAPCSAKSERMPNEHGAPRGTILVVDDEHRVRLGAHRMLAAGGYRVISVATASQAMQMSATHGDEIKLVLTDVFLSDWRGPELAARLREARPELPVVFMSGDPQSQRATGTDAFLTKPFSKQQLLAEVARALPPLAIPEPVLAA